jgi:Dolichyl-phosphate-mannose-protein mannosyltransferase
MTGGVMLVVACLGVAYGGAAAAWLLRLRDPLDRAIATTLLALSQIVLVSLVVGAVLHRFERWPLLIGTIVWDAVMTAAVLLLRPPSVGRIDTRAAFRGLRPWQLLLLAAAGAAMVWRLVLAVVLPPFAYDALTYHLPAVAAWVQTGRIAPNPYALCCSRYPSNTEVLFAWPTVFLGRDTIIDTVQIVTALLGALAVAGLARAAGTTVQGAVTAAALFLLIPIVLTQANTNYNDVTIASMFLVALYFVSRFALSPRVAYALLAGVAGGFALGSKAEGIALAAAAGIGLACVLVRTRTGAAAFGGFAGAAVLVGGWWYAKNWVDTGNPVWPFRVNLFGAHVFTGTANLHDYLTVPPGGGHNFLVDIARSWYQDLRFWTRSDYSYEERSGGLGPLWSWLGWPALTVVAIAALRRRHVLVLALLVPVAIAFAVLPYRWWSRFTIYVAALGVIAVVLVLEHLGTRKLRVIGAVAVTLLALAGGALATWRLDPSGYGRTLSLPDVVSLAAHPSRPRTVGSLFFHEFAWLERVPRRATVAVDWDAPSIRFLYPLFGGRLERHVILLSPGDEDRIPRITGRGGPAYLFVGANDAFARWARARPGQYRSISRERGTEAFVRLGRRR